MTGSILASRKPRRHWNCSPRIRPLVLDGEKFCMACGRHITERWKVGKPGYPASYVRRHVGLWGFWGAC